MRTCGQCKAEKPLTEFYFVKRTGGYTSACKSCVRANSKRWREENPERYSAKLREIRLRTEFGITVEEYDRMLDLQGGACAICRNTPKGDRLHVDHCHETGRIRGLLCRACNMGIGAFREDPGITKTAIDYLEGRHSWLGE